MSSHTEVVGENRAHLGEGPFWDSEKEKLLWVDILGKQILEHDLGSDVTISIDVPGNPGCVVVANDQTLVAAIDNSVCTVDRTDGSVKPIVEAEPEPRLRFNDGKCDLLGRFWVGTMDREETEPLGSLYYVRANGPLVPVLSGITVSNGIGWSPDQEEFYYIDSPTRRVSAFDFNLDSGTISDKRTVVSFNEEDGFPDGMTTDSEGRLWVAFWGGSKILCIDPGTGNIEGRLDFPASKITSCAFGGDRLDQLFVTSARVGISEGEEPLAGRVFVVDPGISGAPSHRYCLKTG